MYRIGLGRFQADVHRSTEFGLCIRLRLLVRPHSMRP